MIDTVYSIRQLDFMLGNWEGEGWIYINRERKTFIQYEEIVPKADSSIMVVNGKGYAKEAGVITDRVIHDAFGVISPNTAAGYGVTMLSFSTASGRLENQMYLIEEKKVQWSFQDERGGTIRFTEDFSQDGQWIENGEYSMDGKQWFPFFKMELHRQE